MESGFTGLANEGAEDIISESSKDQMESLVSDQLINMWTGDNLDPDTMITIGYKDGSTRTDDEISPVRRITRNQSYSTQKPILKQTAFGRNVDFVLISGSWGSSYWAQGQSGQERIKNYTGYEKWTNGRGEKRRDYVQDDWI